MGKINILLCRSVWAALEPSAYGYMSNEILTFGLQALGMLSCNHWSLVFIVFPACSTQGRFAKSVDYLAVACSHCPQQFHRKIVYLKNKIPGPLINIRPSIISLKCYTVVYRPVPRGNTIIAKMKGLQKFPFYISKSDILGFPHHM